MEFICSNCSSRKTLNLKEEEDKKKKRKCKIMICVENVN